jgi:uncharacterized membrane protein (DUF485 family)
MTEGSEKTVAPQGTTTETDTYHDHEGALKWALRLETVAWVPLVVAILSLVLLVSELYAYIPQLKGAPFFDAFVNLGIPVLIPLAAMAVGLSLFFILRAVSHALLLLLDIYDKPCKCDHA